MNKERLERLSYFDDMSTQEVDIIASTMREDAWWDGAVIVQLSLIHISEPTRPY